MKAATDLVALIPARGGSRGIRRKNLMPIAGKPMFLYACEAAAQVADKVLVTTEDKEIAAVASSHGYEVLERPPDLASDSVTVDEVCGWAAGVLGRGTALLVVQPTVPQVTPELLQKFLEDCGDDSGVMAQTFPHILRVHDDLVQHLPRVNRQDMPDDAPVYELGVRFYPARWGDFGRLENTWIVKDLIDIDTLGDLAAVRQQMERGRVVFHFIANKEVGAGHLYRCLALADELQHHEIVFAPTADSEGWSYEMITQRGYVLGGWEPDTVQVADILDTQNLLFEPPSIHLEDSGPGARYADLVVNALYRTSNAHNEIGGARYAVLRPEFLDLPPKAPLAGLSGIILLAFGGTDPSQLSQRAATILWRSAQELRVVLGPGAAQFATDWAAPGRVTFLEQPAMAAEMMAADVVVTSAGRTVFEAAACGTPAVVMAQNTRETTHSHLGLEFGNLYLGMGRLVKDEDLLHAVTSILEDDQLRRELSVAAQGSVDGLGARRIARLVDEMVSGL